MTAFKSVEISDSIDQGDIFNGIFFPALDTNVKAVVITPTCDLEQGKAHFVKFVASVPLDFVTKIIADSLNIDDSFFNSIFTYDGDRSKIKMDQISTRR